MYSGSKQPERYPQKMVFDLVLVSFQAFDQKKKNLMGVLIRFAQPNVNYFTFKLP